MNITILGCDIHGERDPRKAVDVLVIKGTLLRRERRIAVCADCDKLYMGPLPKPSRTEKLAAVKNQPPAPRTKPKAKKYHRHPEGASVEALLKLLAQFQKPVNGTEIYNSRPDWTKGRFQFAITRLHKEGLVTKTGIRRMTTWTLTPKGQSQLAA